MKTALFALAIALMGSASAQAQTVIRVTATGSSDANDGITAPVRTLRRAHEILHDDNIQGEVVIKVGGGDYHCRGMRGEAWTFRNGSRITITSAASIPDMDFDAIDLSAYVHPSGPRFYGYFYDGQGVKTPCANHPSFSESKLLGVEHNFEPLNLEISNLHIESYRGGISIAYDKEADFDLPNIQSDQDITIRNTIFRRIGDLHQTYTRKGSLVAGKGAVLITHSNGIDVDNNLFHRIDNSSATSELLHALYITHGSSRIDFHGNYVFGASGTALKVTDYSNGNSFTSNRFTTLPLVYKDRYCGSRTTPGGTPESCARPGVPDCPSWDNYFPTSGPDANRWSRVQRNHIGQLEGPPAYGLECWADAPRSGVRVDLGGYTLDGPSSATF